MPFSPNRPVGQRGRLGAVLFATVAAAYPIVVYLLRDQIPFYLFALGACLLLLLRAVVAPTDITRFLRLPLAIAALVLAVMVLFDAAVAAKAYPAMLSLLIAAVFGNSLRHPPSLIERLARLKDPALSMAGQDYCRSVTWLWTIWLAANAVIAAGLAIWGSIAIWALWTGLLSYIVTAVLFLGEIVLRSKLQRATVGPR
nr:hypothetical protein [uncultured Dongia sp.]